MNKETLVEIIRRIGEEQVLPEHGILLNLEISTSKESVMTPLVEHLSAKGGACLTNRVAEAVKQGERVVLFDDIFMGTGQLNDMKVMCCLVRESATSSWSGYRLVSLPSEGKSGVQYVAPSKDDLLAVFGSLLVAEQQRHIDSVEYQTVPQIGSIDFAPLMHYFDRMPPSVRVAPLSSELIVACAERGWNLYQLRENRIYSKSGPAQHLLIGETYSVVPACVDPKSAAQILAARGHAKETGQTFHVSCPGVPSGFAPSGLFITRHVVGFEPRGVIQFAMPYANLLHCIQSGHWSSYNRAAVPSGQVPN